MAKKRIQGTVVSDVMDKTVVVEAERMKRHPLYERRYKEHSRYKAHDEENAHSVGETVVIEECRPLSAGKRWRVVREV